MNKTKASTKQQTEGERRAQLAIEWHQTKNGSLSFFDMALHSKKKVWWQCEKGHEWITSMNGRARGEGCPYCSNRKVLKGYNDLATTYPKIAEEWHPTKNPNIAPTDITYGSTKKIWWVCKEGHEYNAIVSSRTRGTDCPYCSNKKVLKGYNDLATTYPKIAEQWHPTKNGDITPTDVVYGSAKKFWWICEHGHEWKAQANKRTSGSNCPYCAGDKVCVGFNDLATTHPAIAAQWHPTKNGSLTPFNVTHGSENKVWWRCELEHEWQTRVYVRTYGAECPYCSNKKVLQGFNDLSTTHPEVAAEWHPSKNEDLQPSEVTSGSQKKVWWQCSAGHEWISNVFERALHKHGCPFCEKKKLLKGYNDLVTTHPQLAAQWHPTKNKGLLPSDVTHSSTKKVWWKCEMGHVWKSRISGRAYKGGCPHCAQKRRKSNVLAKTHPELAMQWHPTKNGTATPKDVTAGSSSLKIWWRCELGHEWESTVQTRTRGSDCPYCKNRKVLEGFNDLATTHPELAAQWHPTKNGSLTPKEVMADSIKKVWWIYYHNEPLLEKEFCFEWEQTVLSRTTDPVCPYLSGKKSIKNLSEFEASQSSSRQANNEKDLAVDIEFPF